MEFNTKISLETKQVLSQRQVESLNILSMPVADLHNFLQNEEIENPLMEYSLSEPSSKEEVIIRDADSFYSRRQTEKSVDMESILSLVADREIWESMRRLWKAAFLGSRAWSRRESSPPALRNVSGSR